MVLAFDQILSLTNNEFGRHDVACPQCGPDRSTKANQKREVLRVWLKEGFASFACARCGIKGHARDGLPSAQLPRLTPRTVKPELSEEAHSAEQLRKARFLWSCSVPILGTPAETYLRQARGITCCLHTLRYLHPRKPEHRPALIAAYGLPDEPEPETLLFSAGQIYGIHLTLLAIDGRSKADVSPNKIMVGKSSGLPIVVASMGDTLGLAITEGIEDALSAHQATGLGAWAAGAAGRMPSLADAIPAYVDCVTIFGDGDPAGERGALGLAARLAEKGIETIVSISERVAA